MFCVKRIVLKMFYIDVFISHSVGNFLKKFFLGFCSTNNVDHIYLMENGIIL